MHKCSSQTTVAFDEPSTEQQTVIHDTWFFPESQKLGTKLPQLCVDTLTPPPNDGVSFEPLGVVWGH